MSDWLRDCCRSVHRILRQHSSLFLYRASNGSPMVRPAVLIAGQTEPQREIFPNHPLFGLPLTAIGRRCDTDDVLFAVQQEPQRLAVVHLTWCRSAEADPQWPATEFFEGERDWATRRMRCDHDEWIKETSA